MMHNLYKIDLDTNRQMLYQHLGKGCSDIRSYSLEHEAKFPVEGYKFRRQHTPKVGIWHRRFYRYRIVLLPDCRGIR